MRRLVPTFFLLLIVFAYTDVKEWFSIHHLLEHFALHQEHNPDMSFTEFLSMHYTEDGGHCGEHTDHRLPFQNADAQHHSFPFPEVEATVSMRGHEADPCIPFALYTQSEYLEPGIEFWQPPKLS